MSGHERMRTRPAIAEVLAECRDAVEGRLVTLVPAGEQPLDRAMHAAVTSPGKRLRPSLVLVVARAFGRGDAALTDAACAVELVHAASLVLDDLPCMDDAELRRGQPTVHRQFGEAVAILAAFALLARAQAVLAAALAEAGLAPAYRDAMLRRCAGVVDRLCSGQALDLELGNGHADLARLERIHTLKTGALFEFAAELGAVGAGVTGTALETLLAFARNLGLAFQVADDLLDATGTSEQAGKSVRRDLALGRTTFVTVFGVAGARELCGELFDAARAALAPLGARAALLTELLEVIRARTS